MSHSPDPQSSEPGTATHPADDGFTVRDRRVARRFLLTGGAAALTAGAGALLAQPAAAASGTTTWVLGGNSGVNTDGTNFLGTKNAAPLVFKTTPSGSTTPAERLRITPDGKTGIGTSTPGTKLDVTTGSTGAFRSVSTSTATGAVGVQGTTTNGIGVAGTSTGGTGVKGTSKSSAGVTGVSTSAIGVSGAGPTGVVGTGGTVGVKGTGDQYGVQGTSGNVGVYGEAGIWGGAFYSGVSGSWGLSATGQSGGVSANGSSYGVAGSSAGVGVYGEGATGVYATGSSFGVDAYNNTTTGSAVHGTGGQYGMLGESGSTAGVRGNSGYVGVWGEGTSWGLYGRATDTGTAQTYGVYGVASNAASFAIFAQGQMHVNGTLSKTAGSFKIDHPLDPERKWLQHSFVESPAMLNIYDGTVALGADGRATITLPDWFETLNRDFRYQLTAIGAPAPNLYVAAPVAHNAFSIAGGPAGLTVSWQVTGVRQDDYAKEHPIEVEVAKTGADRGTRQFVPSGSAAKAMVVDPQAVRPAGAAPALPPPAVKAPAVPPVR